jgi:hypothetical protein
MTRPIAEHLFEMELKMLDAGWEAAKLAPTG